MKKSGVKMGAAVRRRFNQDKFARLRIKRGNSGRTIGRSRIKKIGRSKEEKVKLEPEQKKSVDAQAEPRREKAAEEERDEEIERKAAQ